MRQPRNDYEGIVVVDKPTGMTSHDVVSRCRKILGMRRIGHAGTLDPLATGVLVLLVGKATRLFSQFEAFDKAYRATIILGKRTSTADIHGEVLEELPFTHITEADVQNALKDFVGEIEQTPPMVSAVKHKGRRLYEWARKGIEVERAPRRITIYSLECLDFSPPKIRVALKCSKGTYVRQLAEDLGRRLNSAGCIEEIERTQVGPFQIEEAVSLKDLSPASIRAWDPNTVTSS